MKKIILFLLFIICFLLIGCQSNGVVDESSKETKTDESNTDDSIKSDNNILIVYFSATNNTKNVAGYISNYLNSDIFEIIPSIPYTEDDLKYYTNCRADIEQNDASARPEISNSIDNIDEYNVIFLGYPIWHNDAPKIIYTFLESYNFDGKTIIPFCTSASSSITNSVVNLKNIASTSIFYEGMRFSSDVNKNVVEEWIDGLNIENN